MPMNAREHDLLLHVDAMWSDVIDDKILHADEVTTPTSTEPFFFDIQEVADAPSPVQVSRKKGRRAQPSWAIANQLAHGSVEPSEAPCTEEIPWCDLVFWLGNATGEVECSCSSCVFQRSHGRVAVLGPGHQAHGQLYIASSVYNRLSAKIPVIAMPRIEGVN